MSTSIEGPVAPEAPDVRTATEVSLVQRARQRDTAAITTMFRQFLPTEERLAVVEYLGSIGLLFKTHSFACVTDRRVASLLVRRGGNIEYVDGVIDAVNSAQLYQPPRFSLTRLLLGYLTLGLLGPRGRAGKTVGLALLGDGFKVGIVSHRKLVTRANAIYRSMIEVRERGAR
jgi:hypothetical protein